MNDVKLSPGEEALIASIIEHVYPDPKAGSVLPVEPGEHVQHWAWSVKG